MSRSCVRQFPASRSCSALADAWIFRYTDFGESHDALGRPVLRASFRVGVPGRRRSFAALIDTGGPVTAVAHEVISAGGGDPVDTGKTLPMRLGGRSFRAPLFELTLDARPPADIGVAPIEWRGLVAVLTPFPHPDTSVLLGQIGFLENFTVTFGPDRFAVERAYAFDDRFGGTAD
jgi:hypothetical protein